MHGAFDTSPHRFVAQIFVVAYNVIPFLSQSQLVEGSWVSHILNNYWMRLSMKAEADNTDTRF